MGMPKVKMNLRDVHQRGCCIYLDGWGEGRWSGEENIMYLRRHEFMGELYHDDITSPSGFGNADKGVED